MAKTIKKIRIFSALEVANLCGVVNQTAINWIRNGYLKAFTTPGGQYRIYAEDLVGFLDSRGMRIPPGIEERFKDDVDWGAVLVVEDDAELNDMLKRCFVHKLTNVIVHQAFDGFDAGRLLAEKRPGFLVLDINLPGVDGHALCRKIKEDPGFGKPFIIAVTGLNRSEEAQTILAKAADALFVKPLDFEAVAATIAEFSALEEPPGGRF
jgi:excisionase family DNA binding protein